MNGEYTQVQSTYIRNLIHQTSWNAEKVRKYIDELITLEHYILHGIRGYISGMGYSHLKERYRREWEIIYTELRPVEFKIELEKEKERERYLEEQTRKQAEGEEEMRKDWIEAGGKV